MFKRLMTTATVVMMFLGGVQSAHAQRFCTDTGGCGYEEARQTSCTAPTVALGLVAIGAIIAVGVHNRSHSSHSH